MTTTRATELCLSFFLPPDTWGLLSATSLVEVLTLDPTQLVPIPDMGPAVVGVTNWRGEVLWLLDLGVHLGFPGLFDQAHPLSACLGLVIRHQGQTLGLLVERVGAMLNLDLAEIQSPLGSLSNPELTACLRGYWLHPEGATHLVLDMGALLESLRPAAPA
ncbi:MAG: chemotaxis protein CheW [Gloeomargaritaceae cyanobacterium C42_A2020_066]|nr:chemotaxis protein CheW [Gloeomargaritaceae cyanobacterium C42_A2020_066]